MALKTDRSTLQTDISFFMNEAATRGGVAVISTAGSGASMDNGTALVTYAAASIRESSAVGVLVNDMVDIDLTRQHLNQHKDEVQKGGKVTLLTKGWVVTSSLEGTDPNAGDVWPTWLIAETLQPLVSAGRDQLVRDLSLDDSCLMLMRTDTLKCISTFLILK
jgi:hypothetical protein